MQTRYSDIPLSLSEKPFHRANTLDEMKLYSSPNGFDATISPTSGSVESIMKYMDLEVELSPTSLTAVMTTT